MPPKKYSSSVDLEDKKCDIPFCDGRAWIRYNRKDSHFSPEYFDSKVICQSSYNRIMATAACALQRKSVSVYRVTAPYRNELFAIFSRFCPELRCPFSYAVCHSIQCDFLQAISRFELLYAFITEKQPYAKEPPLFRNRSQMSELVGAVFTQATVFLAAVSPSAPLHPNVVLPPLNPRFSLEMGSASIDADPAREEQQPDAQNCGHGSRTIHRLVARTDEDCSEKDSFIATSDNPKNIGPREAMSQSVLSAEIVC